MPPNPGDFGVVDLRGGNLWNRIVQASIRKLTRSKYCHAVTYIGNEMLGEATPSGYRLNYITEYTGIVWSTRAVPLTPEQGVIARKTAQSFVGIPYGFLDIAALAITLTLHTRTPGFIARRVSDPEHLICSQACDLIDQAMGVRLFDGVLAGEVTPGMLGAYIAERDPING